MERVTEVFVNVRGRILIFGRCSVLSNLRSSFLRRSGLKYFACRRLSHRRGVLNKKDVEKLTSRKYLQFKASCSTFKQL